MGGCLSIDELKQKYTDEGVLLGHPVMNNKTVLGRVLLLPNPDKRQFPYTSRDKIARYNTVIASFTENSKQHRKTGIRQMLRLRATPKIYAQVVFVLLLAFASLRGYGQQPAKRNVLFIGNSLTYFSDMPARLTAMVAQTNPEINLEFSTYPGMSLSDHLDNIIESRTGDTINTRKKRGTEQTPTELLILSRKWDLIVLQEGTGNLLVPESRKRRVNTAIRSIRKLANDSTCQFAIVKTWISINTKYPQQYCHPSYWVTGEFNGKPYCSATIRSMAEERQLLSLAYDSTATETQIGRVEIGRTHYALIDQHPEITLYEDDYHPSPLGAYLNACLFYKFLTGKNAVSINYVGDVDLKTAQLLREAADNG